MGKRQSEKLTPATSKAKYPTLLELRREGGFLFNGVAAAILATGLAGCGKSAETSSMPDGGVPADMGFPDRFLEVSGTAADMGSSDRVMEVSGTTDLGSPDRVVEVSVVPDVGSPDRTIIIDGVPYVPPDMGGDSPAKDALDDSADTELDVK